MAHMFTLPGMCYCTDSEYYVNHGWNVSDVQQRVGKCRRGLKIPACNIASCRHDIQLLPGPPVYSTRHHHKSSSYRADLINITYQNTSLQCFDTVDWATRKGIGPVKKVRCWYVGGDDLTSRLTAPVVTTTSIILSSNKTG